MVDMCFDFLPLISRVAETSPLLEKLYMYELGVLYYDYDPQTQQMVTDSLQAAVTRMAELKKFTMYGTCYLSERVNDILRDVADRLEEYAVVGIQTWEVLQFALSSCRSLRRLCVANYICKPEPMEFRCELVQLTSLVLIGACKGSLFAVSAQPARVFSSAWPGSSSGGEQPWLDGWLAGASVSVVSPNLVPRNQNQRAGNRHGDSQCYSELHGCCRKLLAIRRNQSLPEPFASAHPLRSPSLHGGLSGSGRARWRVASSVLQGRGDSDIHPSCGRRTHSPGP